MFPQHCGINGYKQSGVLVTHGDGRMVYKTMRVHRLIALAFHGLPPLSNQQIVVGHLDDDPGNNRPDNLRWMTQSENCNAPGWLEKQRAREARRGENHPFYGRQHSPETRAKMSAGQREAAARRRLQAGQTPEAGSARHA
ncbi:MAG: HNH endonuclease [Allorhizobium sp.]